MCVPDAIVVDSDHAGWRAFQNEYWPALYFVDALGRLRHHQFGEGNYEESERVIQQLLSEAGAKEINRVFVAVDARGTEAAADWGDLKSPETYLGYERAENPAAPRRARCSGPRTRRGSSSKNRRPEFDDHANTKARTPSV